MGGVLKLAGAMWKQMSEAEKQPWDEKFKEHTAAYAAYESSDAYVEPEKKQKRNNGECYAPVQNHKTVRAHHPLPPESLLRQCTGLLSIRCSKAEHMKLSISLHKRFGTA